MPVVINELTITVDVQPRDNIDLDAARSNVPGRQDDRTKTIVRECIDAVMDTLRNKSER